MDMVPCGGDFVSQGRAIQVFVAIMVWFASVSLYRWLNALVTVKISPGKRSLCGLAKFHKIVLCLHRGSFFEAEEYVVARSGASFVPNGVAAPLHKPPH